MFGRVSSPFDISYPSLALFGPDPALVLLAIFLATRYTYINPFRSAASLASRVCLSSPSRLSFSVWLMKRQNMSSSAITVEVCKNRRVLAAKFCKKRRILAARTVENYKIIILYTVKRKLRKCFICIIYVGLIQTIRNNSANTSTQWVQHIFDKSTRLINK